MGGGAPIVVRAPLRCGRDRHAQKSTTATPDVLLNSRFRQFASCVLGPKPYAPVGKISSLARKGGRCEKSGSGGDGVAGRGYGIAGRVGLRLLRRRDGRDERGGD